MSIGPERANHDPSASLRLNTDTRLLVIAPHPDDETLATGGLLQQAHALGADMSVFMLTHGDNNPWPQRWLEKRWHIGAADRQRWGQRRMGESRQALARLGLGADILVSPGWPDMGLTDMLLEDGQSMRRTLVRHVEAFRPNLVIVPALADGHPDHSAAHLLARAALADCGMQPACFEYLVHGTLPGSTVCELKLDSAQHQRKRQAVLAYTSQVTLSRRRLLRLATDTERFYPVSRPAPEPADSLPWRVPAWLRTHCEVLLHREGHTWLQRVPESGRIADLRESPGESGPALYFKLRLRWRSPWIFDHWGWRQV